jgi:hypothetical protein
MWKLEGDDREVAAWNIFHFLCVAKVITTTFHVSKMAE